MKIRIEEIYSKNMFPGLIIGKPKDGDYEKSLNQMKEMLGEDLPIHNTSEVKWKQIKETTNGEFGYGSWGNITGVKIRIVDGWVNYDFSIIFNFYPEVEKLEDIVNDVVDLVDWKNNSFKWDDGDL
ncbi:MAG: hypothetical protein ACOC3V_05040 [bacterium]